MTQPRLDAAHLLGAVLSFSLFGLYTGLFFITAWVVRTRRMTVTPAIIAIGVLWLLNVACSFLDGVKVYMAFVVHPEGSMDYFLKRRDLGLQMAFCLIVIVAGTIADATICWRLYIIWSRDCRVLVFPITVLIAGLLGCSLVIADDVLTTTRGPQAAIITNRQAWSLAMCTTELVLNALLTGLIIAKLWRAHKTTRSTTKSPYTRIILALVESGALYIFVMGACAISVACGSIVASTVLFYLMPRLIGIVPTMIVLQLSLGFFQPHDAQAKERHVSTIVFASPEQQHPRFHGSNSHTSTRTFSVGRPAIQQQQLPTLALPSSLSHISLPHHNHYNHHQQQQQRSRSHITIPSNDDDYDFHLPYVIGDATDDDATPVDTPERTTFLKKGQYALPLNGSCDSLQCDSGCGEPVGQIGEDVEEHLQGRFEQAEDRADSPV
ncbi:hypothetical protein FS837_009741 [Tulasnella sp. UAMH 9824]|nr:hypothetical protein FS837_009741 [Tulasnella sp. UAMH 9824]